MRITKIIIYVVLSLLLFVQFASTDVRLKDVAFIKDQSEIQLKGLGLVMGLNGTGDGKNTQFTIRMIGNLMSSMNIEVPSEAIKVKNVAAVMVTATVSPYIKVGGTFDVTVSSIGDAKSLDGGTLLMTALSDINDILYGFSQGPLSIGGSNRDYGGAGGIVNNAELAGIVPGGGMLQREVPTLGMDEHSLTVSLRNPDYTTAYRLSTAINGYFEAELANARDAGTLIVQVPDEYANNQDMVKFISEMEVVSFRPDEIAKVVINERTGTIIAGTNVSLAPVAIMHGMLSLTIGQQVEQTEIQPMPSVQGQNGDRIVSFGESANVGQIARALNMLGVTPRDLIAIFQALKASGSLRAKLVII